MRAGPLLDKVRKVVYTRSDIPPTGLHGDVSYGFTEHAHGIAAPLTPVGRQGRLRLPYGGLSGRTSNDSQED